LLNIPRTVACLVMPCCCSTHVDCRPDIRLAACVDPQRKPAVSILAAAFCLLPGRFLSTLTSTFLVAMTMLALSIAAFLTIAWPMPRAAPVMKTVLPRKDVAHLSRTFLF